MALVGSIAKPFLRIRPIGTLAVRLAHQCGCHQLRDRLNKTVRYVPPIVRSSLDCGDGRGPIAMHSAGGRDHVARLIWQYGVAAYEAPLPRLFARAAQSARTVLDVGANSGLFTIIAAHCSDAQVHAFEPFPPAREWLERNIALNQLGDRVHVLPTAVSHQPGTAELYVPTQDYGDVLETSASLNSGFRPQHSEVVHVAVTTLDAYVNEAAVAHVDLIHVDVESLEPQVLAGAMQTLQNHRPLVVFEVTTAADLTSLDRIRQDADLVVLQLRADRLRVCERVECDTEALNCLFCPSAKLALVREWAQALSLGFEG